MLTFLNSSILMLQISFSSYLHYLWSHNISSRGSSNDLWHKYLFCCFLKTYIWLTFVHESCVIFPASLSFSYSARSLFVWCFNVSMKFLIPLISNGGCTHWRKIKYFYKQKGLTSNFTCVHWKYKHHIFEFWVSSVWWVKRSILHCTNRFYCQMFSYLELFLMYIFLSHIFLSASVLSGFLVNFSLSFVYDALYCCVFTLFSL